MSKLLDYLTNSPSATPVNASFEVQATETPSAPATQALKPVNAPARKKRFKRIGKPTGQRAVSAQGKNLTVVASSVAPVKTAPKNSVFSKINAKLQANKAAKPQVKKTPVKTFFKKPGVKKAAIVGAAAAMPIAAGAYLAIKNRKAIAAGAKKVLKKIKIGRR